MKTLEQIKSKLLKIKPALSEKYGVCKLGIYGSYAYGMATENSDLDIYIDFNKPIGLRFIDLCEELEGIMGLKVDVATKSALMRKPGFLADIQEDLIYV